MKMYKLSSFGIKYIYSQIFKWCISKRELINSNKLKNIAIDESLFVKDNNGIKYWDKGFTFSWFNRN